MELLHVKVKSQSDTGGLTTTTLNHLTTRSNRLFIKRNKVYVLHNIIEDSSWKQKKREIKLWIEKGEGGFSPGESN